MMRSTPIATLVAFAVLISPAYAQHQQGHAPGAPQGTASPYAGYETRTIKALSPQQVDDLKTGRGMGLALAAELNGYPGPLHVLELAEALGLSDEQRRRVEALRHEMKAETSLIGERIIADEAALDRLFADQRITPASLKDMTAGIAEAQGKLRAAHLRYHLLTRAVLTPEQVSRYNDRRGYAER